jgi:hypothetical protein
MHRRQSAAFLLALGAVPIDGLAQQAGRTYRVGVMTVNPRAEWARKDPYLTGFVERLLG